MLLYHTGEGIIREPDVHAGRSNADFGPGVYLSPAREFTRRWARREAVVNVYELDLDGLEVLRLQRSLPWVEFILRNRQGHGAAGADVVIGPIANDTLFETMGLITGGFFSPEQMLALLQVGPAYVQAAVRTERATAQLRWIRAEPVIRLDEELRLWEQEAYQQELAEAAARLLGQEDEQAPVS